MSMKETKTWEEESYEEREKELNDQIALIDKMMADIETVSATVSVNGKTYVARKCVEREGLRQWLLKSKQGLQSDLFDLREYASLEEPSVCKEDEKI